MSACDSIVIDGMCWSQLSFESPPVVVSVRIRIKPVHDRGHDRAGYRAQKGQRHIQRIGESIF